MLYVLILFAHTGPLGDGNSNSLAVVPTPFKTEAQCIAAGRATEGMASGSTKKIKFVCVPQ